MNLYLYGHAGQWLMIDCGITFDRKNPSTQFSNNTEIHLPDIEFIASQKENLAGLIVTHAHEDHMGAIPYLWKQLQCKIYTTPFTAEMLRRKWIQHSPQYELPLEVLALDQSVEIGAFKAQLVTQTHSIPETSGVVLSTAVATVYHSADWKLEKKPVLGVPTNPAQIKAIGKQGIDALICDSTCADVDYSISEASLYRGLYELIDAATGRVVVACFGTNIARLKTLAKVADCTHRHLGLLGRSLKNTVDVANETGIWCYEHDWVATEHLGYLPRESLLLIATGSQAEPNSALCRMSRNTFHQLELDPGDTVIFSARKIPGNINAIDDMIARLHSIGVNVFTPDNTNLLIHASGHPSAPDLQQLYQWLQPTLLIPIHGEPEHMQAQVRLAKSSLIKHQLIGKNGDLFKIAPSHSIVRDFTPTGRLTLGNTGLEKVVASGES